MDIDLINQDFLKAAAGFQKNSYSIELEIYISRMSELLQKSIRKELLLFPPKSSEKFATIGLKGAQKRIGVKNFSNESGLSWHSFYKYGSDTERLVEQWRAEASDPSRSDPYRKEFMDLLCEHLLTPREVEIVKQVVLAGQELDAVYRVAR